MAIRFNKNNKVVESKTSKSGKWCSITIGIQIVLTIILGFVAFAPFLQGFAGIVLAVLLVVLSTFLTGITAGIIWSSKDVRIFFKKGFSFTADIFDKTGNIIDFLKPYIFYITIPMFIISSVGFIYNLIYYIKHEKANKGRFITSCILLGLALVNLIVALVVYLTLKK